MSTTTASSALTARGGRKARPLTIAAAVVAAVLIWSVAELSGMHLRQPGFGSQAASDLNVGFVIATSAVTGLAGWGLLALIERFTSRPRLIWTTVAVVFLLLSFGGPLSGSGVTAGNRVVLALFHATVGAIVIGGLSRTASSSR